MFVGRVQMICTISLFFSQLPEKMEIIWNKKMRKTAGYCVTGQTKGPELQRYARIELSEKVCDSAGKEGKKDIELNCFTGWVLGQDAETWVLFLVLAQSL